MMALDMDKKTVMVYFIVLAAMEVVFLSLLLKSSLLCSVYLLLTIGTFLIVIFPEIGIAIALSGNHILYYIFDKYEIQLSYGPFLFYLFLVLESFFVYSFLMDNNQKIKFGKLFHISIVIGLLLAVGTLYSADRAWGLKKTVFYFLLNVFEFVLILILGKNIKRMKYVFLFTFLIGVYLAIESFVKMRTDIYFEYVRFALSDNVGPLNLGRSMGISVVAGTFFITNKESGWVKFLILGTIPFLISPMIWTGSRGPLLGLAISLFLFYLLQPQEAKYRKIILGITSFFAGLYYIFHSSSQVAARLETPVLQEASAAFRILAWIKALQEFAGSPLTGIGTGSFHFDTPWGVPMIYPHNLIIEMACELGIIGLIAISWFIILSVYYGFKNIKFYHSVNNNEFVQYSITAFSLFVFGFLNAMFTGSIFTNSLVWFGSALIWILFVHQNNDVCQVK